MGGQRRVAEGCRRYCKQQDYQAGYQRYQGKRLWQQYGDSEVQGILRLDDQGRASHAHDPDDGHLGQREGYVEASGVAQFAGGPEDRRLRLVLLGPLSDQRLFCGRELASRVTAAFLLAIYVGYLPAANLACKARDSTRSARSSAVFRTDLRSSRGTAGPAKFVSEDST